MHRRKRGPARRKVMLALLIILPTIALFLPPEWTGFRIRFTQLLAPFHDASTTAANWIYPLSERAAAASLEEVEALRRGSLAADHSTAVLQARITDLEERLVTLAATRNWSVDGRRIGSSGRLVPANVIGSDMAPWRSSNLISAGSLRGVRRGGPVVSRFFTVNTGTHEGLRPGLAILHGEVLLGFVEQAAEYASRITLLSDLGTELKVRTGRRVGDRFVLHPDYFWLQGRGLGKMEIRDAQRRDVQGGAIAIGDLVLSDPEQAMLSNAMVIGRVIAIDEDHENPLLSILQVESPMSEASIKRVYVFDPADQPSSQ